MPPKLILTRIVCAKDYTYYEMEYGPHRYLANAMADGEIRVSVAPNHDDGTRHIRTVVKLMKERGAVFLSQDEDGEDEARPFGDY